MTVDTIIKNGSLVTENEIFESSIAIDDGKISSIGNKEDLPTAHEQIDADGKLVLPGIVDPHVHLDDVFANDTYETGSSAAALGGVTTFIDFAWQGWISDNTPWNKKSELPTLKQAINDKKEKGDSSLVDYGLHAGITREDLSTLDTLAEIVNGGISSFKMFTSGGLGLSNGYMDQVFDQISELNAVAVLHTEEPSVCEYRTAKLKEEGKNDPIWYPRSRPDYSEAIAAESAVHMAAESDCKYYGIHTTCEKAADVLARFRDVYGRDLIRAETCTHYTALTEDVYEKIGNLALIKPPIRKQSDQESMFRHLNDRTLDVVSTDHNSFKKKEKQENDWWDVPFGAPSIQYSFPVFHDVAVQNRDMTYPQLVRVMATNPARIFGLDEKGTLTPGTDADIVIFDPNEEDTITAKNNAAIADYTIYEGREVTGKVKKTFVRGKLIADDGTIVAEPGCGDFLERECPNWDF